MTDTAAAASTSNRPCDAQCGKAVLENKTCAKCHSVWYCTRECQVANWKKQHKLHCPDLTAAWQAKQDRFDAKAKAPVLATAAGATLERQHQFYGGQLPQTSFRELRDNVLEHLRSQARYHGFSVVCIPGGTIAYTAGLAMTYGVPELVMTGLGGDDGGGAFLNRFVRCFVVPQVPEATQLRDIRRRYAKTTLQTEATADDGKKRPKATRLAPGDTFQYRGFVVEARAMAAAERLGHIKCTRTWYDRAGLQQWEALQIVWPDRFNVLPPLSKHASIKQQSLYCVNPPIPAAATPLLLSVSTAVKKAKFTAQHPWDLAADHVCTGECKK